MKPEQYKKSTLFRLFVYIGLSEQQICRIKRIAEDCRVEGIPTTLAYQTDSKFDFWYGFHLGMDESKMNMENLSAKLGDLHLSFKSNIEIPKCQIDTLK